MRRFYVACLLLLVACAQASPEPTQTPTNAPTQPRPTNTPTAEPVAEPRDVRVLVWVPHLYGANSLNNLDNFEGYGWQVTLLGLTQTVKPCTRFAGPRGCNYLAMDVLLPQVDDISSYDVLAIMPATRQVPTSPPYEEVVGNPQALELIAAALDAGLVVFAPCSGLRVLAAADVVRGRQVTGSSRFKTECAQAGGEYVGDRYKQPPPVIDGNLVTVQRGLYYNIQNAQAVATALETTRHAGLVQARPKAVSSQVNSVEQEEAVWARTFGGPNADGAKAVVETDDGGLIIAGYTYSFGAGNADVYLVKTDAEGNESWSRAYGGSGWEYAYAVVQTSDGGYAVAGYSTSFGAGSKDIYLLKVDADGNQAWSKTFGGPGLDAARSVQETQEGGFIIAGYTESSGQGEDDAYLVRTDAQGNELWSQTYGKSGSDMGQALVESGDGGYLMFGGSGQGSGNRDFYLVKVGPQGEVAWMHTYGHGDLDYDWGNALGKLDDGGTILVGNHTNTNHGDLMNVFLVRIDSSGEEDWRRTLTVNGFFDTANSIDSVDDGGFVIAGASKNSAAVSDAYVLKTNAEGKPQWTRLFGGEKSDRAETVIQTADGGYVIAGQSGSFGAGAYDVWVIKIGPEY